MISPLAKLILILASARGEHISEDEAEARAAAEANKWSKDTKLTEQILDKEIKDHNKGISQGKEAKN